ncbi:PAS domain S-box-containing protein/diguanylate cyclase (GGDEF) domain-containing protein [Variovorax sp. NFACC28]|nr:PAS domain S-box-containing protein/diguanylate cyclase (GGDEF) domain-containing protein [Variovorax sp. NFACC28]SEG94789.1 PAS domain S-box-containing protein/diguanylate cyclase (GGDEF) domain-containing protein [Variovorax sp. NFACC29]SFD72411.1 PAS domain S-box-containing protein/diguanylate cyclase (GGDEF) domain-containing protein [Variovorax sp. NFACC26]SFG85635.1 PAS domain S-box-containing protein/diguanylate cyclase (GGDEF) domain-containing protein [Variovorax sp. NFACC27]
MTQTGSSKIRLGLHTRLSLGVAAVVLLATFAIATVALHLVKSNMRASIAAEELARVSAIADAIDQKFDSRRILLQTFGGTVKAQDFQADAALQAFLEKHVSLRQAFDNVAFLDMDGNLVANLNGAQAIGKVNVKDRAYFQQTVASRAGLVSEPYRNRLNGLAQVAITEPVLDHAGQVRFVISGAINLKERNVLGTLTDVKFGKTGYLFVTTTDGVVVDHPRTSRILNQIQADGGGTPQILRALAGFQGSSEGVDEAGVPALYAFDRAESANWIVGALYPRSEAFATVDAIERGAWLGALALAFSAGALALAVARRQLRPLADLHRHMRFTQEAPEDAPHDEMAQRSYTRDEIGDLARTFDELMEQRRAIERSLAHSEAQVRIIADSIPAMVSHVDASLRYTFVNAHVRALHNNASLVGRLMPDVRGPADFAVVEPHFLRALAGETVIIEKSGDPALGIGDRTFKAHYIPDLDADGKVCGVFSMTFDISEEVKIRRALTEQETRLRDVTDSIPALVGYFDRQQNCLFANVRARQMAGLGEGAPLQGTTLRSALGRTIYSQLKPYLPVMFSGKKVRFPVRAPLHGKQGYFQVNLIPDKNLRGEVVGFYLMSFNITALKEAELRQAESELRLRAITDNMPALITYIDRDEKITFANATSREWLGLDPAQVLGRHIQEVAGREVYVSRQPMLARALAGERVEFESRTQRAGFERITQVIYVPDVRTDGLTHGIFSLALDITALKVVEHKLIELARLDTLTGLPNRLAFNEYLPDAVLRGQLTGHALALMFLDIDHFKAINDTMGHAVGDAVLAEYARRLQACVRGTDMVARLAGDEFVLVLEGLGTPEAAAVVAEKIVQRVHMPPFVVDGQRVDVTTSIGIAFHRAAGSSATATELLARADAALYNAKAAGRDRFAFFMPSGESNSSSDSPTRQEH